MLHNFLNNYSIIYIKLIYRVTFKFNKILYTFNYNNIQYFYIHYTL